MAAPLCYALGKLGTCASWNGCLSVKINLQGINIKPVPFLGPCSLEEPEDETVSVLGGEVVVALEPRHL